MLYGDRLGTNLLAIGAIDEATLAAALGAQHGVHAGHGAVLFPEPQAIALVDKSVCIKRNLLPHHVIDRVLYVVMSDPSNLRAIDEIRFLTKLRVQPIVVCEARMWKLLAEHCGESVSMRPNPLDLRGGAWRPIATSKPAEPVAPTKSMGDIGGSDEEFQAMYAKLAATPLQIDDLDVEASSPSGDDEPPLLEGRLASGEGTAVDSTIDSTLARQTTGEWQRLLDEQKPVRARLASQEIELVEEVDVDDEPQTIPPEAASAFAEGHNESQIVTVDLGPISFDDAIARLSEVKERDEIARIVLRAARTTFDRAALLTVYPHAYVGWMGTGDGFEDIHKVSLTKDAESVFSLVEQSRAHYRGPLQKYRAHGVWVKATGRRIPRSLIVLPILVRGTVTAMLVADDGHDEHVQGEIGELLILAQHIAASFESLLTKG